MLVLLSFSSSLLLPVGRAVRLTDGAARSSASRKHHCSGAARQVVNAGSDQIWRASPKPARRREVRALLETNTSVPVPLTSEEAAGAAGPALWSAIGYGSVGMVKASLEAGASLDRAADGTSPLEFAIVAGDVEVFKVLLEAGASLVAEDASSSTPLSLAIGCGSVGMVKVLLEAGASPQADEGSPLTPLNQAINRENLDMVKALLEAGASLEADEGSPLTPLEYAIHRENLRGGA